MFDFFYAESNGLADLIADPYVIQPQAHFVFCKSGTKVRFRCLSDHYKQQAHAQGELHW